MARDWTWDLVDPQDKIGTVSYRETDQPWFVCDFKPLPSFARHERLFQEFEAAVNSGDPELPEKLWQEAERRGIRLVWPDDPERPNPADFWVFNLWLSANELHFRPSGEVFKALRSRHKG